MRRQRRGRGAPSLARSRRPRAKSAASFVRCVVESGAEKAPRETTRRTYRPHSHTRIRSPLRKLKNAHAPRRRPDHLGANHKHKRVKHTTADSRARPPTFVPRFTHSSLLAVPSPLTHTHVLFLSRTLIPSLFLLLSRLCPTHILRCSLVTPFSLSLHLLLLLRRSLARRDRLYGKARVIPTAETVLPCYPVCLNSYEPRLSHADHSGAQCRRRSHVRTASSRKSNLKIFENNNKMAGKSLRDHCGQTMAMIGSALRARPIGATLCGCFP